MARQDRDAAALFSPTGLCGDKNGRSGASEGFESWTAGSIPASLLDACVRPVGVPGRPGASHGAGRVQSQAGAVDQRLPGRSGEKLQIPELPMI